MGKGMRAGKKPSAGGGGGGANMQKQKQQMQNFRFSDPVNNWILNWKWPS